MQIRVLSFIKKNWFIIGIFIAIICGYNFSEIAKTINKKGIFLTFLVFFIFFIQGLTLQNEKIFSGIKNIKLHILLLFFTFAFFPLYFFAFIKVLPFINSEEIIAGLFVLACLPTTIASCVVFTGLAKGNTASAIFNSVISNILGIFITPLLFSIVLATSALALPLSMIFDLFIALVIRIIIPMGVGMVLRNFAVEFIDGNKNKFSAASSTGILFIVFTAFAASSDTITADLLAALYPVFIFLAVSYWIISFIAYKAARLIGFRLDDVIAAVFVAPQKTLALGAPLITLYFKDSPEIVGIIMIPLLFYHPWQLFSSPFIAKYFLKKNLNTAQAGNQQ